MKKSITIRNKRTWKVRSKARETAARLGYILLGLVIGISWYVAATEYSELHHEAVEMNAYIDDYFERREERKAADAKAALELEAKIQKDREYEKIHALIKGTPMEPMGRLLMENEHGINPYLVIGIAKAESNLCRSYVFSSDRGNYNCFGIKPKGGQRADGSYLAWYSTPEQAVESVTALLSRHYIGEGKITVEAISKKYVGNPAPHWVETVSGVLAKAPSRSLIVVK